MPCLSLPCSIIGLIRSAKPRSIYRGRTCRFAEYRTRFHMSDKRDPLVFDRDGLIPAVIQDWRDGTVLMVGYMNQLAITHTISTRFVHFWSRSRRTLWKK